MIDAGERWDVHCEITHSPDVVSYLVDAVDADAAERAVGDLPEVRCVHEVIRVERAEP